MSLLSFVSFFFLFFFILMTFYLNSCCCCCCFATGAVVTLSFYDWRERVGVLGTVKYILSIMTLAFMGIKLYC